MKAFTERWERGMVIIRDDLHLLASLYLAQFIVWRTLRRRRKEDSARRKKFKLLNGADCTG